MKKKGLCCGLMVLMLASCFTGCDKNVESNSADAVNKEEQVDTDALKETVTPAIEDVTEDEATPDIDEELAEIEKSEDEFDMRLQADNITQTDMTIISGEIYKLWDDELNSIWKRLTEQLDAETMETLKQEQLTWITTKEEEVEKAGAECEGGSIQPMIENAMATELTKTRVYELAEYLRKRATRAKE